LNFGEQKNLTVIVFEAGSVETPDWHVVHRSLAWLLDSGQFILSGAVLGELLDEVLGELLAFVNIAFHLWRNRGKNPVDTAYSLR
jgi:hypothetical protein